jgi:hypothetical protein
VNKNLSTTEQLNNLIDFRQDIFDHGLVGYRDAQFELLDALLSTRRVHSFAELTLSPLFRRGAWCAAVRGTTIRTTRARPFATTSGVPWLSFVVYPTHRKLKRRNVIGFTRRLEQNIHLFRQGRITFSELDDSVQGWINHVRYGDTWRLRERLFQKLVI